MKDGKKWEEIRKMGKNNYAIKYGLFFWGIIFASISTIFLLLSSTDTINVFNIITNGLMWLFGGYFFGIISWQLNESKFRHR